MIDIGFLLKEFAENSSGFNEVLDQEIDNKHKKIISNSKNNLNHLNYKNFRNWNNQNDMGLKYPMTQVSKIFLDLRKNFFLNGFTSLLRKRLNHIFEYSSMVDDINVLKYTGYETLLNENPQKNTPGALDFPLVEGYSVSTRWLRYLYILSQFDKHKLLSSNSIWVDIGSYYGGLQGLVKKYNPDITMILVDFNHQLLRSFIYLKNLYPDCNHVLPNQVKEYLHLNELKNSIIYVDVDNYQLLEHLSVDLITNFFSLGEMKKSTFRNYLNSSLFNNAKIIYLANRVFSSPFFDKTYDDSINLLDYLKPNFSIDLIDSFPVGVYNVGLKKVFDRMFFRNFSSQYFEIILKKIK